MTTSIRFILLLLLFSNVLVPGARGNVISIGALSYDTFIPAAPGSSGADAFDIANLTGGFGLPPDFPVSDNLTFQDAVLTLTLSDSSQQVFNLGKIGPGFLLDGGGNPVVQVSSSAIFKSAELKATLSPTTFMLFDGSSVTVTSTMLDTLLLPSSGPTLTADVDQTTINVSGSPATSIPEPASLMLLLGGGLSLAFRPRRGSRGR